MHRGKLITLTFPFHSTANCLRAFRIHRGPRIAHNNNKCCVPIGFVVNVLLFHSVNTQRTNGQSHDTAHTRTQTIISPVPVCVSVRSFVSFLLIRQDNNGNETHLHTFSFGFSCATYIQTLPLPLTHIQKLRTSYAYRCCQFKCHSAPIQNVCLRSAFGRVCVFVCSR